MITAAASADPQLHLQWGSFDPLTNVPAVPSDLAAADPGPDGRSAWLLQFQGPIQREWTAVAAELGIWFYDYIPDFAFLVRATDLQIAQVLELDAARWAGLFPAAFKVAPALLENGDGYETYRVRLFAGFDPAEVSGTISSVGVQVLRIDVEPMDVFIDIAADPGRLADVAAIPEVAWIEPKYPVELFNDLTTWVVQSNVSGSYPVWNRGIHGEGQVVGILDSGLDYGSCFFRDGVNNVPNPFHRKVIGYRNYGGAGGNVFDSCILGHGTHVSGTCAGEDLFGSNQLYNGVAHKARITFGDIQGNSLAECLLGMLNIAAPLGDIFGDAYNDNARIHTNSWGSTENAYDSMAVATDSFMWQHPDFLIIFAAGNSGPNASTCGTPGVAKNVLTVGATNRPPSQNGVASYSSRGPAADGRRKPTLCAPGTNVNSARNTPGEQITTSCNILGFGMMGTSMAAPAVAGSAVLTRQYYTDGFYPTGAAVPANAFIPSAALVKATLVASAAPMTGARPSNDQGWGRVLLDDALYFAGDTKKLWIADEPAGVATGDVIEFPVQIAQAGQELRVLLVWTDYPGAQAAARELVNDLDLEVQVGAALFLGNNFANNYSVPGGMADRLNTEEGVILASASAGTATVRVRGFNVPSGAASRQPFAIVVTGALAGGSAPTPTPTSGPGSPTPTPTQPATRTPTNPPGTPTPTATRTVPPTATPTRTQIPYTPTPTRTPTRAPATATPTPAGDPAVSLDLNQSAFAGGETLILRARLINPGPPLTVDHYLVLDIGAGFGSDRYYFWPDWTVSPTFQRRNLPAGGDVQETILNVQLPAPLPAGGPFTFLTALLAPNSTTLIGEMDSASFSFR